MKTWVLITFLTYGNPVMVTQEFNSKETCYFAASEIEKMNNPEKYKGELMKPYEDRRSFDWAVCVLK